MIIERLIIITVDGIFSGTSWYSPHGDPVYEKWKLRVFDSQPPTQLGFPKLWSSFFVKKKSQKVDSTFHDDMVMTSWRSLVQVRWTSWTQLTTWELKATKVRPLLKSKIGTPKELMLFFYPRDLFQVFLVVCKMKRKKPYSQTHLSSVVLSCFSSNNLPKCSRCKWASNIRKRPSPTPVAPSISVDLKTRMPTTRKPCFLRGIIKKKANKTCFGQHFPQPKVSQHQRFFRTRKTVSSQFGPG